VRHIEGKSSRTCPIVRRLQPSFHEASCLCTGLHLFTSSPTHSTLLLRAIFPRAACLNGTTLVTFFVKHTLLCLKSAQVAVHEIATSCISSCKSSPPLMACTPLEYVARCHLSIKQHALETSQASHPTVLIHCTVIHHLYHR
jgi:hypothetical protein